MSRVWVVGILALLAAVAGLAGGVRDVSSLGDPAQAAAGPVVDGYPYANRCPAAGRAEVVDRWGMYACNCTSYVAWALSANGQRVDWFVRGSMDAWNWPNVARRAGLTVDRRAGVGEVAVWPRIARPFGHVAYVTDVRPDHTIDVAEYNYPRAPGANTFSFEERRSVPAGGALFVHVPRSVSRAAAGEQRRKVPLLSIRR
ncbi:MAG TPA: CHAP domain-containing protein [Gaiellaceae bacterium]